MRPRRAELGGDAPGRPLAPPGLALGVSVEDVQLDGGKENPYIFNRKDFPFRGGGDQVITSKLTSKAQTTIPQPIRTALHLKEGDEIAYAIEGERVIMSRAPIGAQDDPFATFGEWATEADREAYGGL